MTPQESEEAEFADSMLRACDADEGHVFDDGDPIKCCRACRAIVSAHAERCPFCS